MLKVAYYSLVESPLRHSNTALGNSRCCKTLQYTQDRIVHSVNKNIRYTDNDIGNLAQSNEIKQIDKKHNIYNINELFSISVASQFADDPCLAKKIDHQQSTRRGTTGGFSYRIR